MEPPENGDANSPAGGDALHGFDPPGREPQPATIRLLTPLMRTRRPLLVSTLLVGSLALGILAALTPRYETNDDAGMNLNAAGRGFVDRPDEHLLFTNVILGQGLKFLYQSAPAVPWYGGYLFVVGCVSLVAICFACLRDNVCEWTVGMMGVFLWVAGIPFLTQLQFTRIAFLAGLAGLLLLAGALRVPGARFQKLIAIPFLLVGGLIRSDSLRLLGVALAPVILWMLWRARFQKSARIALLILVACGGLILGGDRCNEWYYARDSAWRDFYPFNALRAEIVDFGRAEYNERTATAFKTAGWLPIDLLMLRHWIFLDRDRYNVETLRTILEALPPSSSPSPRPWKYFFGSLARDGEWWGLLACGAACLGILATDRGARFVPLACYAVTAVFCIYLYRFMHLPPRVYCPAFCGCAATSLLFSTGPRSFGHRRQWVETKFGRLVALAVLGALIVWRTHADWRSNANFLSFHKSAVQMLKELAPREDQLFVIVAGDFPMEFVTLPLGSRSLPANFKILAPGWTTGFTQSRMDEFGFQDLLTLIRRKGQTFFICQKSEFDLLSTYFRSHYGLNLTYRVAFAHPVLYGSAVYQVSIKGATPRS